MSKYIIDIPNVIEWGVVTCRTEDGFYTRDFDSLEVLNSDYINEHFGELQDQAYHKGLEEGNDIGYEDGVKDGQNETWECAKKLFSTMAESDIEKAFPIEWNNGGFNALMNLQPHEAIERLKAYEEKQKADEDAKRGDVVRHKINGLTYIVTLANESGYVLLDIDGNFATSCITNSFEKTGKHVDIDKILEGLRYDN